MVTEQKMGSMMLKSDLIGPADNHLLVHLPDG